MPMTPRERVLAALNHQEPDRVPIDLGGTRQSGIAASAYHQLKQRLGLTTPTRVFDLYQVLAEVEEPVMACRALKEKIAAFNKEMAV